MSKINLTNHTLCFGQQFTQLISSATSFFNNTPVIQLPPSTSFNGAGVYALYYTGRFTDYSQIVNKSGSQHQLPIYVGKAVPSGARKGKQTNSKASSVLFKRLNEHSKSIGQAKNIAAIDFKCRFMVFPNNESGLIGAVESALIKQHSPLWNSVIDGFGNHDPGSGRHAQSISEWDFLHPGRKWASKLTGTKPLLVNINHKIQEYNLKL